MVGTKPYSKKVTNTLAYFPSLSVTQKKLYKIDTKSEPTLSRTPTKQTPDKMSPEKKFTLKIELLSFSHQFIVSAVFLIINTCCDNEIDSLSSIKTSMLCIISGLYYKRVTIVIDAPSVVSK